MDPPGLFFFLVRDNALQPEHLAPLLSILPPERIVSTSLRDGEAFDSTRWPVIRDALLAGLAARRLRIPELDQALDRLEPAFHELDHVRAFSRMATARVFAAGGANVAQFMSMFDNSPPEALAVFDEPPWPLELAGLVQGLAIAYLCAAEGLYAYYVYRGLPAPGAEPASRIVREALERGCLSVNELVNAAVALVDK